MADHTTHTYHTEPNRSSGTLAFIVGALVVAVAVLAYFIFGAGFDMGGETVAPAVEINNTAESAAGAATTDDAASATATTDSMDDGGSAAAGAEASDGDAAAAAGATSE